MVVTKVRSGAWAIYSGTPTEVVGALEDDGIPQTNVVSAWSDAGTCYALIRQGV